MQYQHPITYLPTGNVEADFKHALEGYDATLNNFLPADKSAEILDVGCGWGQFLWWLKGKGYTRARGVDIGSDQERHCRSIGLTVSRVDDSTAYLHDNADAFDLITLHHIIEHLETREGLELLRAAHKALRPGGRIIVQTPNMSAPSAGFSRYIEITHVTGYTESSLGEILQMAGFKVSDVLGNKTPFRFSPRRMLWVVMQKFSRQLWRLMLMSDLGTDTPRVLEKNLFAVGIKE